ncbi:YdeI/OmpD-associated family protein [Nocardia aobensis]|uniref:YdeI/OmpD-associated family protein n=1 Tax=Nocardia aobensis TaxID=257277 RepID=A0ABW6PBN4_9NOCA
MVRKLPPANCFPDAALAADTATADRFAALDRTARHLLVLPLLKARTPTTKARRLAEIMATLQR